MGPIDYSTNVQQPFQAALQGYGAGAAIRDDQFKVQQQQAAQDQAQRQQQLLAGLAAKGASATADDYAGVMTQIPALSEHLGKAWATKSAAQQQAAASDLLQWGAAIKSGNPEIASELMTQRADAIERAAGGPTQESQGLRTRAQLATTHPQFALGQTMAILSANPQGKDAATALSTFGKEARDEASAPYELAVKQAEARIKAAEAGVAPTKVRTDIANTQSLIDDRAARLGLDRDKLTSETQAKVLELNQKFGQLPDDARKLVNDSALTAVSSEQQVQQYQQLAGQIDQLGSSWGAGTGAHEWLKRTVGSEDAVSALKREYTRMASQGVIKLLPPGPASDKDIENAKAGIPPANASPEVMASYLRGMSKLSAYDAVLNNAKAEWAGAVQHLGRAKQDIEIDGVKVPAGTTFNDFARKYISTKADALNTSAALSSRGYLKYAQPPAAAPAAAPAAPLPYGD